ncbi:MAG: pyruvate, phosphate dikinase [Bacteroidales bacterium]|nr:pyruvate, phosphate dikinase [Bacteroidales bacterium]
MENKKPNLADIEFLLSQHTERVKELTTINRTTTLIAEAKPIPETLQQIALILPRGWQYPQNACARILFDKEEYKSLRFKQTEWVQRQDFATIDGKTGVVEVYYSQAFPLADEGSFLTEERNLIINIANLITGFLNTSLGGHIIKEPSETEDYRYRKIVYKESFKDSRQLLQKFLDKQTADKNIFHDLMRFKVKEILLVATLYDTYILENEDRFFEQAMGEIYHLSLSSLPRITGVTSPQAAIQILKDREFDFVILMVGVDTRAPIRLSDRIRKRFPEMRIYLLLNNNSKTELIEANSLVSSSVDQLFIWNGDSKVFFAMVKLLEDRMNLENDTEVGLVRVILLVEDSPRYYSRYLPMLYTLVFEQTQELIAESNTNELDKILRMRARTKIILATTYERAISYFTSYQDYLACVISDVKFTRGGKIDETAGISFLKHVHSHRPELPAILQSSDSEYESAAIELKSTFMNKNSETLLQDLKTFITYSLGYGHFIYRDTEGRKIAVARSMKDFEKQLRTIPDESILYHALKNNFSLWLMARGEVQLAKIINPIKASDLGTPKELREYILDVIENYRIDKDKGKVVNFDESAILDWRNIVSFGTGSLGGKGRGLAFINTLINNLDFSELIPDMLIITPRTAIIGTDEFEIFMERNGLRSKVIQLDDYMQIRKLFLAGELSFELKRKLKMFVRLISKPLAVRSSSIFEDSLLHPFAGIFETYVLPNSDTDFNVRFRQLQDAVKMVYASIFSTQARTYFEAVGYKIEEEKMAVIIQELVGNHYGDYYYPHISGTAQSYNYYPVAHMKPEDGLAVVALGLGRYVVEGEKSWRFSPKYPTIQNATEKDQFKTSQVKFIAADLKHTNPDLLKGEDQGVVSLNITEAEKHGTLTHLASVYDPDNDRVLPGLDVKGPRIINFADILQYDYAPLAKTIDVLLDMVKEAIGTPVEIEYAVDLHKDALYRSKFYLLQIKPMVGNEDNYHVDIDKVEQESIILYAEKSLGNGRIDGVEDVVYIDPADFDRMKTKEMADEITVINNKMRSEKRKYILIGPGRWGTRDRFIGIPVKWPQISNARVIVETELEDFAIDASLGSHFFHNVTSMNVGYFSIHEGTKSFINYDFLNEQSIEHEYKFFRHIRFQKALTIIMDGKKRHAVISNSRETDRKDIKIKNA